MATAREDPPVANRGRAAGPANRRALIAAAREVYAEGGLAAPLSAVAKRAGVGQGSLYRHFPDRAALAVAVFEENVAELEAYTAPADRTIDDLLDRVASQAMVSTAFVELITAHLDEPRVAELGRRYEGLVARVVEREHAAGALGAHIELADVVVATSMLVTMLARIAPEERAQSAARARALFHAAFKPRQASSRERMVSH